MSTDLVAVAFAALDLVLNSKVLGTSEPGKLKSQHTYSTCILDENMDQ